MMESLETLLSRQQKVNGHTCPHLILNSASRCSRKQLRRPDCSDDAGRQVLA